MQYDAVPHGKRCLREVETESFGSGSYQNGGWGSHRVKILQAYIPEALAGRYPASQPSVLVVFCS